MQNDSTKKPDLVSSDYANQGDVIPGYPIVVGFCFTLVGLFLKDSTTILLAS